MRPNPVLKKLGFSNHDRLVIIHTDDIGMCHASVQAYTELVDFGLISSGATMVPCSWFPQVADYCRHNTNADMGVHITLTSEWESYRWSPISSVDRSSGLIDTEGYFFRSSEEVQMSGNAEAAQKEMQFQLDRAFSAGIDVSHIDTHMNTVAHAKFITSYVQLAIQNKLPFLFPRLDKDGFQQLELDEETSTIAANYVHTLEEEGIPLLDCVSGLYLDEHNERLEQAKKTLASLPSGITHFIIHPSVDTPELRAITPDWQCRVADYQTFMDANLKDFIRNIGIQIIGYRLIRDIINTSAT
jgi:hypothetical protein